MPPLDVVVPDFPVPVAVIAPDVIVPVPAETLMVTPAAPVGMGWPSYWEGRLVSIQLVQYMGSEAFQLTF
jgi:hypothetical protein